MNHNVLKKALGILCLVFFSILLLIPCITLVLMAFKNYKLISGLFGSPYVGFSNIQKLLHSTGFIQVLKNTLNINILSMAIGAIYLFAAFLAINVFQNRIIRAFVALIFALPAVLPLNTYNLVLQTFLPTEFLVSSSPLLQIIAAAEGGLRFSAIFVIAALFSKGESVPHAQKYVLLFIAMKLIHILVTDTGFLNTFYNPLTYEHLDTYSTYKFRLGLMQSQFSSYAAGYVVQLLIQLLPALLGIFIVASPHRKQQEASYQAYDSGNRVYLPCMLFAALPIALLLLVWKAGADGSLAFSLPRIRQAYAYGFLTAAVSAIVIVSVGLLLAIACVYLGSIGIGITAALYFLSDNLLGPYMVGRTLGTYDTIFGILVQNFHLVLPIAIIAFKILREHRRKNLLPALAVSSLSLAFAWFWGDHTAALITLRSAEKQPLSLAMHQLLNQPAATAMPGYPDAVTLSAALYILIPILVTGFGFLAGSLLLKKYE